MAQKISINNKSYLVNMDGYEHFWKDVNGIDWEPETFAVFDANIDSETLYLDIGAWIGPTVFYAAQLAQKSVAFEPDPVAFPMLQANLALNTDTTWHDKITLLNQAVDKKDGTMVLGSQQGGGDSMSSILFSDAPTRWEVETTSLATVLSKHAAPKQKVFLKIDIEGGEYALVPKLKDILADPSVTSFISLHPHFLRRSLKKSANKIFGVANPIQTRRQYLSIYRELLRALPDDRKVEINGKVYKNYFWFLLHAVLRLRTPNEILIRN